jgi:hypothetical protein
MDNDVQNAPVAVDEPVQAAEPTQPVEQVSEAPEATTAQEVEQTEATEPSESTEDTDEDFDPLQYTSLNQNTPYQFNQENGYIDPNQVAAQIEQRVLQQVTFQRQEARAWEKIEKKYPEIREDKGLREMILNQRIAEAVTGRQGNLNKIADGVMSRLKTAKSEGRADANISKKVQKAASLETSSENQGPQRSSSVMDRIASGDQTATTELLNQWISEGKL